MSEVYSSKELAEAIAGWKPKSEPFGPPHDWEGLTSWVDEKMGVRLAELSVPDRLAVRATGDYVAHLRHIERLALELAAAVARMPDVERAMISRLRIQHPDIETIPDVL